MVRVAGSVVAGRAGGSNGRFTPSQVVARPVRVVVRASGLAYGRPPPDLGRRMQGLRVLYDAIPWFFVLSVPVAIVTLAVSRRHHRQLPARPRLWRLLLDVALAWCLLGIACVTLLPTPSGQTGLEWGLQLRPVVSIVDELTSAIDASVAFRIVGLNIVLFIPLGFLLRIRPIGWLPTIALVPAISLAIEALQAVLPLGRTTNIDDVLLNTLGGLLGAGVASLALRTRRRSQIRAADAVQQQDA